MPPSASDKAIPRELVAVARKSYERCCAALDFFPCFYRNFFRACPVAKPLFAKTDFRRQHKLLQHAIGLLLAFPNDASDTPSVLARVAERHSSRDLDIDPALYTPFVESLIQTVREHDSEFTDRTEDAWRRTLAPGVRYMQSRHA